MPYHFRLWLANQFTKWTHWEFLPMAVTNLPVVLIWLWYSLRARDLLFFTAVNPVIETGGMFGESKINIIERIPPGLLPKTVFVKKGGELNAVLLELERAGLTYPVLAKPNVGERGYQVKKIQTFRDLELYHQLAAGDYLIQEFVDLPLEFSVLAYRLPDMQEGKVTSVCIKRFLTVEGDGVSSVHRLMWQDRRARLQIGRLRATNPAMLDEVLPKGQFKVLEPIGNHCRGTTFLNGNHLIDEQLSRVFVTILQQMEGVYYGRFDLKCRDIESLKNGSVTVLEFNGVAGEPAHIYDPTIPVWKKYRDISEHWGYQYEIYRIQKERGVTSMSFLSAIESLFAYFKYKKAASG